jgi:hypothetical protein
MMRSLKLATSFIHTQIHRNLPRSHLLICVLYAFQTAKTMPPSTYPLVLLSHLVVFFFKVPNRDFSAALSALQNIEAVCDCLIVGNSPDHDLLRLCQATGKFESTHPLFVCSHSLGILSILILVLGGLSFQINNLSDGYEILESLSVVSLYERRNKEERGIYTRRNLDDVRQGDTVLIGAGKGKGIPTPKPTVSSFLHRVFLHLLGIFFFFQ